MPHVYRCPRRPNKGIDTVMLVIQEAVSHQMVMMVVVVAVVVVSAVAVGTYQSVLGEQ